MKPLTIRALNGPNVYHHEPVLVMLLDLESLADTDSAKHPGFTDALLAILPGLQAHHCGLGRPGGFVERLRDGTYFGHIVEHVALELSETAGIPVNYGQTRQVSPTVYRVVVRYASEPGMRALLGISIELVESVLAGAAF